MLFLPIFLKYPNPLKLIHFALALRLPHLNLARLFRGAEASEFSSGLYLAVSVSILPEKFTIRAFAFITAKGIAYTISFKGNGAAGHLDISWKGHLFGSSC